MRIQSGANQRGPQNEDFGGDGNSSDQLDGFVCVVAQKHQKRMVTGETDFVGFKRRNRNKDPVRSHPDADPRSYFPFSHSFHNRKVHIDAHHQGPDLYAFLGFIGPDDMNYMCFLILINYLI